MSEHTEEITIAGVSNSNEPKWLIDVNKSKTDALCNEINEIYAQAFTKLNNSEKG